MLATNKKINLAAHQSRRIVRACVFPLDKTKVRIDVPQVLLQKGDVRFGDDGHAIVLWNRIYVKRAKELFIAVTKREQIKWSVQNLHDSIEVSPEAGDGLLVHANPLSQSFAIHVGTKSHWQYAYVTYEDLRCALQEIVWRRMEESGANMTAVRAGRANPFMAIKMAKSS